jgi:hypothetical protein
MREMQLADGAFASSLDADSEGEEGRYYVWARDEIRALLTDQEWRVARDHWGLDGPPNFENSHWHLRVAKPVAPEDEKTLADLRAKLLARRETRVRPGCDDKVLTAWNALMIEGLARAGSRFGRQDWLVAARRTLGFIQQNMWQAGRLQATARAGRAHLAGYLDDYAFLLQAVLELIRAAPQPGDLQFATELADALLARFEDKAEGGFHFTADDHEALIHRPKPAFDNSLPGGNAIAARALLRLGELKGDPRYREAAVRVLDLFVPQLARAGGGGASLLMALEDLLVSTTPVNAPACTAVGCTVPDAVEAG